MAKLKKSLPVEYDYLLENYLYWGLCIGSSWKRVRRHYHYSTISFLLCWHEDFLQCVWPWQHAGTKSVSETRPTRSRTGGYARGLVAGSAAFAAAGLRRKNTKNNRKTTVF